MTHDTLRAAAEAAKEALNDICAELGARLAPEESFDVRDALVKKFGVVEELIATLAREPEVAGPAELTDERIDHIADLVVKGMPEGIRGFCKAWGWRQFARAILEDCRGHVRALSQEPPAQGEREAFEAWWLDRNHGDEERLDELRWLLTRGRSGDYREAETSLAWFVWQARAALPHPPAEGSQT
jgi:hypothetical protein